MNGVSSEYQCGESFRVEYLLCHFLQDGWCELLYMLEGVFHAFELVVVEEGLGGVEGVVLEVVAGYSYLAFYLLDGSFQFSLAEGTLHEAVEFVSQEFEAAVNIVCVASEIDGPSGGVSIVCERTLYGVDQSAVLAQSYVET